MSKRGTGLGFIGIAAFLYGVNYVMAIMWMPHVTSWNDDIGRLGYAYKDVGNSPTILAFLALAIGVAYLLRSELPEQPPA